MLQVGFLDKDSSQSLPCITAWSRVELYPIIPLQAYGVKRDTPGGLLQGIVCIKPWSEGVWKRRLVHLHIEAGSR